MADISRSGDCGNSPKNRFAEEFVIALLMQDRAKTSRMSIEGLQSQELGYPDMLGISIEHVVTHGKVGAVSGTLELAGGQEAGFCFVITFSTAKADRVSNVVRYVLPEKKPPQIADENIRS